MHELKNMNPVEVFNRDDPNYSHVPEQIDPEAYTKINIPEEAKKIFAAKVPEYQDGSFLVNDELTARAYEDRTEIAAKYFSAKWDYYVD